MEQKKLRVIRPAISEQNSNEVYGIQIPNDIAVFYNNVYFRAEKTDNGILLVSGMRVKLNFNDVKDINLEDYKV